jgi:hypothetical protein
LWSILGTKESKIVLLQALEHIRRHTSWKLAKMKRDEKFADVDWKMLNEYLPDKLLEELDEENDTNFHQQLSQTPEDTSANIRRLSGESIPTKYELQTIPTVYQIDSIPSSPITRRKSFRNEDILLPVIDIRNTNDEQNENIRNELIVRFLTATSIDYEKQWFLGMIRRKTLDILIKSVEQAKQKCSLHIHWQLILTYFQLTIFLQLLMKFDYFHFVNQWTNQLLFDHIFQTIELTLGKLYVDT